MPQALTELPARPVQLVLKASKALRVLQAKMAHKDQRIRMVPQEPMVRTEQLDLRDLPGRLDLLALPVLMGQPGLLALMEQSVRRVL